MSRRPFRRLFARHHLDIRPSHLLYALAHLAANDSAAAGDDVERLWSPAGSALACYSVRSGFHLLLSALQLPRGSEVLFSAVTHPDMPRIAAHHGLTAVPVDLDAATLGPRPEAIERALSPRSRVFVVAHLFGGHADLTSVADACGRRGVLLVEDCAQAFAGLGDTGDVRADVSMFSFGILKTATALGGAILTVANPKLADTMRAIQTEWPVQRHGSHLKRIAQVTAVMALTRPMPYAGLATSCALLNADFDRLVNSAGRAFPAGSTQQLIGRLEQRPGAPLLRLLAHRLRAFDEARLLDRAASGDRLARRLPPGCLLGAAALDNTNWLFPVRVADVGALIASARHAGFDAASSASSVNAIASPPDRPELEPTVARSIMSRLVFLPAYPELPAGAIDTLAAAIAKTCVEHREEGDGVQTFPS